MALHEVRDGRRTIRFEGVKLGWASNRTIPTEEDIVNLEHLSPQRRKYILGWTELHLYRVDPGQGGSTGLDEGGYFYQTVGESRCYHRMDGCLKGSPYTARETTDEALPCPVCKPPRLWEWVPVGGSDEELRLTADPGLEVRLEIPLHKLYRAVTAHEVTEKIERDELSAPANRLLDEAQRNDPAIAAVYARPAPPRAPAA
jgi:hypothetical protein